MARFMRILALHPKEWALGGYAGRYGCEVRHVSIGGNTPTRLDGTPSMDGIGEKVTRDGIDSLLMAAREFKPDVMLFGIHFGLTPTLLQRVKDACGCKLVMHYTDQRDGVPDTVSEVADQIDLLLLTNRDEEDHGKYRDIGLPTETFYDGFSPDEYYPSPIVPRWDAMFGGNNFAGLARELEARRMDIPPGIQFPGAEFRERFIIEAFKVCELRILGNYGWKNVGITAETPIYHPHYIRAMHSSKVILSTVNAQRHGLLTRRLWRSVASGRLYLTEYIYGMESHFEDGVHLAWFKTVEEGLDKLRWYLDHDEEREKVGRQGHELLLSSHTNEHRLREFRDLIRRAF